MATLVDSVMEITERARTERRYNWEETLTDAEIRRLERAIVRGGMEYHSATLNGRTTWTLQDATSTTLDLRGDGYQSRRALTIAYTIDVVTAALYERQ